MCEQLPPPPIWSEWVDGEREMIGGYPDVASRDRFIREQASGDCGFIMLQ